MEFSFDLTVDRDNVCEAVKGILMTIFFYRTFGSISPQMNEFLESSYPSFSIEATQNTETSNQLNQLESAIDSKIDQLIAKLEQDINDNSALSTPLLKASSNDSPLGSPGRNFSLNSAHSSSSNSTPQSNNPYANIKLDEEIRPMESSITSTRTPMLPPTSIQGGTRFAQVMVKFYELKKLKKPTWFGKVEEESCWETWILNIRLISPAASPTSSSPNTEFVESLNDSFGNLIMEITETCDQHKDHIPIITKPDLLPFNYNILINNALSGNESWKGFIKKMLKDPIS